MDFISYIIENFKVIKFLEKKNYLNLVYKSLILICISSFILGFFLREDSGGGGRKDFTNTWNNMKVFDNHGLIDSLRNTKTSEIYVYINSHFPTNYILNKYLNPFSKNQNNFLFSIFCLNFLYLFFFYYALKIKFIKADSHLLLLYSSIIFLSPYFRTSSYWASLENYGIITIPFSYLFYLKYSNEDNKNAEKKFFIFLFSIFSCFSVYFDQKLLIIPLIYLILFFRNEKNLGNIIFYIFINLILSIPVLSLIFYWEGVMSPHDSETRKFGNLYFEQIGYSFTIIFFYLIPFILLNLKKIFKKIFYSKKDIFFLSLIFILYIIILENFPTSYPGWEIYGRGWASKLENILFENYFYKKIFKYFLFYISLIFIYFLFKKNLIFKLVVIFFCSVSVVLLPIFQKYFDPLIFILLSFFFYKKDDLNKRLVIFNFLFYFCFLSFNYIYYIIK